MRKKKKYYKMLYIYLCLSVMLLFMHLTPTAFVKKEMSHPEESSKTTHSRELYDESMMSPDHLLGLMPKKINEFMEQYLDEELVLDGQVSYCSYLALLKDMKALQRVLYQMFICLVTLICIHTTRKILLRYIYNTDGPRRRFSPNITF